jgi:hypothetical protein
MACDCPTQCPASEHCIAIYIHDTGECWVLCSKDEVKLAPSAPVPLDAEVDVDTRNVDLVQLGTFLSSRCDAELLIPAKAARKPIELKEKKTTLRAAVEQAGMVVGGVAD